MFNIVFLFKSSILSISNSSRSSKIQFNKYFFSSSFFYFFHLTTLAVVTQFNNGFLDGQLPTSRSYSQDRSSTLLYIQLPYVHSGNLIYQPFSFGSIRILKGNHVQAIQVGTEPQKVQRVATDGHLMDNKCNVLIQEQFERKEKANRSQQITVNFRIRLP